ncbi:S-layer homology domain-containing protein [Paenibacillus sp. 2TAB19]|uniref:S-layer homology domain-containing protein n=1 Tax=Paenibacillus sp. 2TAB19 TaxID=3233003 RepID=UPI003F945B69
MKSGRYRFKIAGAWLALIVALSGISIPNAVDGAAGTETGEPGVENAVYAYHADPVKEWETRLSDTAEGEDAFYTRLWQAPDGSIYVTRGIGDVLVYNTDGTLRWRDNLNQRILYDPIAGADGRIYISGIMGRTVAYDPIDGRRLETTTTSTLESLYMLDMDSKGVRYSASRHYIRGSLSQSSRIEAVNSASGPLWSITIEGKVAHPDAVFNKSEDTLYVVSTQSILLGVESSVVGLPRTESFSSTGTIFAIDATNGKVRWNYKLAGEKTAYYKPLVLDDGTIIAASWDGMVEALDSNGKLIWSIDTRTIINAAPYMRNGQIQLVVFQNVEPLESQGGLIRYIESNTVSSNVMIRPEDMLYSVKSTKSVGGENANNDIHFVSFDHAGNELWQTPVVGQGMLVSTVSNDNKVAVLKKDGFGVLSYYDLNVTKTRVPDFTDLDNHWAKDAIMKLAQAGIVEGFLDGTYRPDTKVTREQFVAMLAKKLHISEGAKDSSVVFNDVATTRWSKPAIDAALFHRWILAEEFGGSFVPQQLVTREEMAVWTARALKLEDNESGLDWIKDKDMIKAENRGLVGAAVAGRLISGYSNGRFEPQNSLSRAEAAIVLTRIY